jgi:hypothetical protein
MYLAPLLLQMNDVPGYERCRAQILEHFGNTSDPRVAERMVKSALILPPPPAELAVIAKMAEVAGQAPIDREQWGYNLFAMGFTEYRLGQYARATNLLQQAIPLDIGPHCRVKANLVLSMAQFHLGQSRQSHDSFANAIDEENRRLPKAGQLDDDDEWEDWVTIQILKREATVLNPGVETLLPAAVPEKPAWQTALANAGWKFRAEQQDDGTWDVELDDQPLTDLSIIRDAPISRLSLAHTSASDLGPLKGMPLKKLWLGNSKVTDLAPLAGMRLTFLQISATPVADISPLRGLPLRDLKMSSCTNLSNVDALKDMTTLENVILPPNAMNFEILRHLTNLTHISFKYDPSTKGPAQTAAAFWAQQDASQKTAVAQP